MWLSDLKSKNNLRLGLALGFVTPWLGTFLVFLIFGLMVQMNYIEEAAFSWSGRRMRTIMIIGICTNIYWIQLYNSRFTAQTSRGVVLMTMAYCVSWFVYFAPSLYEEF